MIRCQRRKTAGPAPKKPDAAPAPEPDCPLCPRLQAFRQDNRTAFPDFHNAPVASFGPLSAHLLIVGLAPGLKGANRTGRPFTGDHAGDLLYPTLIRLGLASGDYDARPDDTLGMINCRITNALRCVPPANRPTAIENNTCRRFLIAEIEAMPELRAFLALGRLAHQSLLHALGHTRSAYPFSHGASHDLPCGRALVDSYHCSRYNTNTGRLTSTMFEDAMETARRRAAGAADK